MSQEMRDYICTLNKLKDLKSLVYVENCDLAAIKLYHAVKYVEDSIAELLPKDE